MTSLVFPDVNVWLALATTGHVHHKQAKRWFETLDGEELIFCRLTQIGLLRLLTTKAVMGPDVLTHREAWLVYDTFIRASGARFLRESGTLDDHFRKLTHHASSSPKEWVDSYLTAFAIDIGATLITFDQALANKVRGAVIP